MRSIEGGPPNSDELLPEEEYEDETPFVPDDPFYSKPFNGSDKQMVASIALHEGHKAVKEIEKKFWSLFGF